MSKEGKKIKESLMQQLKEKNADVEHFISLVDDYVWYYEQEKAMQDDIKKRGLSYKTISSQGKEYLKDNPSIKNAVMYKNINAFTNSLLSLIFSPVIIISVLTAR